ncbi:MAG: HEPN domain-containing protein [bacterium]|nr:HEPN domain-containing protein [bacterium]
MIYNKVMLLNTDDIIKNTTYWRESSEQDLRVAQELFKLGHYPHCLFFCHLSVEKILKAIVVGSTKEFPPYTHDLRKLAEIGNVSLNKSKEQTLDKISTFNIAGRYADAKFKFYQKYNKKETAIKYLNITENLIVWLKIEFRKTQLK